MKIQEYLFKKEIKNQHEMMQLALDVFCVSQRKPKTKIPNLNTKDINIKKVFIPGKGFCKTE